MYKIGLVGAGYWSVHHLNAWHRIPGAEVTAICDRNGQKREERGLTYNVPKEKWYESIDEMLAEGEIDVVDMVTGPDTHLEFVTKAAKAGKHIMCQKPFAASVEEAMQMVKITEQYGVRLMVTENWRWLQPNQILKRVLDEGLLGRIRVVRYTHTDFYTPRMAPGVELPQPFFREMPRLLFYEMGAHWFDTIRFLFGHPQRLYAETLRFSSHIQGEDSGIITLGYEDHYVVLDMSWATRRALDRPITDKVVPEHREMMVIEGEHATAKLYRDGRITCIDNAGIEKVLADFTELDHGESHHRLQSHFIQCLEDGEPFQTSGADNLKTLELMFAVYDSAQKHEVIKL